VTIADQEVSQRNQVWQNTQVAEENRNPWANSNAALIEL
jgi:hypothetical protein